MTSFPPHTPLRRTGSVRLLLDSPHPSQEGIRGIDKPPQFEAAEPKGAIVDLTLVLDVLGLTGTALQNVLDPFLKAHAQAAGPAAPAPASAAGEFRPTSTALTIRQRIQKGLEARGIILEEGSTEDGPRVKTVCGLDAAYRLELVAVMQRGVTRKDKAVKLLESLKERGCALAAWYNGPHARDMLRVAKLRPLFDCVMDASVMEKTDLRPPPEPDAILKCCADLGVSPFEVVLLSPHGARTCAAGASANLGLVLGGFNEYDPTDRGVQEEELFKEGADMVVNVAELTYDAIAAMYSKHVLEDPWRLSYRVFLPADERLREAMTSLGNGYMGNRGGWEGASISPHHYPATYLAPVFDTAPSEVKGRTVYNSDMVNLPNWCLMQLSIDGEPWVDPFAADVARWAYSHALDLKAACLRRRVTFRDQKGRVTTIESARMVSMHAYHTCALQYTVVPENYSALLTLRSSIDGDVINDNVARYDDLTRVHLTGFEASHTGKHLGMQLLCRTINTDVGVGMLAKHTYWVDGEEQAPRAEALRTEKAVSLAFTVEGRQGHAYTVEKVVSIFSSIDVEFTADPSNADRGACLGRLCDGALEGVTCFAQLLEPHKQVWADFWDKADIVVDGDRFVQTMIRAHTYHLLATASPHRSVVDAGLPARGLCGEGYRGHVFWDEVYMFPFYLSTFPEVARAHLAYRIKRLPEAREYAAQSGYRGAMYPWQTSDTGHEETQVVHYNPVSGQWDPDDSCRQRHVGIAVFMDAYRYWHETADVHFLEEGLAEMMLEIALFWCSLTEFDPEDGKYHTTGVMGPDEFHEKGPGGGGHGVRDNAYTNVMIVWLVGKAQELLEVLAPAAKARIVAAIGLTEEDMQLMTDMQTKMCVEVRDGIIQQFVGFADLKEVDWDVYRKKYQSVRRFDRILKAEGLSPDDFKVIKQPDALMIYYLLKPAEIAAIFERLGINTGDDIAFLRRNYDYYLARTSHGSTLSFTVMATIAKLCGRADFEWEWFMEAAKSDLYDRQGTTHEGIHCAVMAGTLEIIVGNFAGLREDAGGSYRVQPALPKHWRSLSFKRLLRDQWFEFHITTKDVRLTLLDGPSTDNPVGPFFIGNNKIMVCPWSPITVAYNTLVAMRDLFDLMWRVKFVCQSLVGAWFEGGEPHPRSVGVLRHALQALESAPAGDGGRCQLVLEGRRRIAVEMSTEKDGLRDDLIFFNYGVEALLKHIARQPTMTDMEAQMAAGAAFLGTAQFRNFIAARNGTINPHCGRHATSIQAAHNAIFLTTFARGQCTNAVILSAAPLQALRDVCTIPEGVFHLAGSLGKEVVSRHGVYYGIEVPKDTQPRLELFNQRVRQLLKRPDLAKFAMIGSGLQFKLGQTTVARGDVSGSVTEEESAAFVETLRSLALETGKGHLKVVPAEYDVEIVPADGRPDVTWTKGTGLEALDRWLRLDLAAGSNLVCGSAAADLAMLKVAVRLSPEETSAVFVTIDPALQAEVRSVCPRCHFVPAPDVLITLLFHAAVAANPA